MATGCIHKLDKVVAYGNCNVTPHNKQTQNGYMSYILGFAFTHISVRRLSTAHACFVVSVILTSTDWSLDCKMLPTTQCLIKVPGKAVCKHDQLEQASVGGCKRAVHTLSISVKFSSPAAICFPPYLHKPQATDNSNTEHPTADFTFQA